MTRRQIRAALRQRAPFLPPALATLGFAVWQIQPESDSHDHTQQLLPSLVRADVNLSARPVGWQSAQRHLLICAYCSRIYLDMVELARSDARGELPSPPQRRAADLDFLKESTNE